MKPVVDRLKASYAGRANIRVLKPGNPDYDRLSAKYGIEYVPTFVFLDSSGAQRGDAIIGETSEADLKARINALR